MKNVLKYSALSAVAIAAVATAPVGADASVTTAQPGFYDVANNKYYTAAQFKMLTKAEKIALLTSEKVYLHLGASGVVSAKDAAAAKTEAELASKIVAADKFTAANLDAIHAGTTTPPVTGDLKVESVSAINAKTVVVKFNDAVKKSDVIGTGSILNTGKVSVQRTVAPPTGAPTGTIVATATEIGGAGTTAVLSEDGKTLTVTLVDAQVVHGTYTVTVKDVISAATEKKVKEFASTFSVEDKVAPTVEKAEFNATTGNIELTYSEPIEVAPTVVRVNGQVVSTVIALSTNQKVVTITRPSFANLGTTASVYVANALDGAANPSVAYTGDVVLTADASALQVVSATQQASNKIRVVFNKSLNTPSITLLETDTAAGVGSAVTVLNNGVKVSESTTAGYTIDKVASDTTNKTFDIVFAGGTLPHYTIYGTDKTTTNVSVVYADAVLEDVFGQKLASATQQVTLTKDLVALKAVSAKPSADGTKIEVTFDEAISATPDASKIVLRKDGIDLTTVASATQKATSGDDAKVLVITPATTDLVNGKIPTGTYTVRLDVAAVTDAHGNKNAATNVNATVAGVAELTVTGVTTPATNAFEVVYSSAVTAATALSAANYTIDGAPLPAGTDIKFKGATGADARTVVITLPAQSNNIAGQGELAVKNVQTAAGVTLTPKTAAVTLTDNKSPELVSATLVSSNLVKLTFSEALTPYSESAIANILGAIEISAGSNKFAAAGVGSGTPTAATASASTSGKDILLTVVSGDSNWATITASSSITVKTLDNGTGATLGDGLTNTITDANTIALKAGTSITLTK